MKKEAKIFLKDILESIERIEDYTKTKNEEEFLKDYGLQDMVIRRLEIIDEAVKNIPVEVREIYLHVLWKRFAGMKDIFIHRYFGIDLKRVWKIAKKGLPEFKKEIPEILKELGGEKG